MLVIFLLIIANGLFAMSEIAIVSARKARLQQRANEGSASARAALELASQPNRFLSTVQVGITLIGTLAGAFGGARIATDLQPLLENSGIPLVAQYSEALSVGIVVLVITYLSLVIGELAPKRIALTNSERIAALVAPPMKFLAKIAGPVVSLLSVSTEVVVRLLGVKPSSEPNITDEEIKLMLQEGTEEGVFEPIEEEIVEQLFRLSDRRIDALITPRIDIVWLDLHDSEETLRKKISESGHARFPVAESSLDNVLGLVLVKDLLAQSLSGQPLNLQAVMQPALFVPQGLPALEILEQFKENRSQIALIIDEYGGLDGLVTIHDVMEAIIGDVPEAHEPPDPEARQREDGSWLIDGGYPLDEFEELFDLVEIPPGYYQTLAGFVMASLGRIPRAGDHFVWDDLHFEVVDMDWRRVDKVLVSYVETAEKPDVES